MASWTLAMLQDIRKGTKKESLVEDILSEEEVELNSEIDKYKNKLSKLISDSRNIMRDDLVSKYKKLFTFLCMKQDIFEILPFYNESGKNDRYFKFGINFIEKSRIENNLDNLETGLKSKYLTHKTIHLQIRESSGTEPDYVLTIDELLLSKSYNKDRYGNANVDISKECFFEMLDIFLNNFKANTCELSYFDYFYKKHTELIDETIPKEKILKYNEI